MLKNTMIGIIEETWPSIFICMVILVSMRLFYLIKNKETFVFYKEIMILIFVVYVMCLFYVVTFQDVSWSSSNFIPFKEMFRYDIGSKLFFKNVMGNMLMFVPYGIFISYFLRLDKTCHAFFLVTLLSISIESTQLLIGRVFDVDDIILNIVGGVFGYYVYYMFNNILRYLPSGLKKSIVYNIILVLFIVLAIIFMI